MGSRLQKRIALRKKIHIFRALTRSKCVKRRFIIMDALLSIYKLKLKLEAIKREYSHLMENQTEYLKLILQHVQVPKNVKVQKVGQGFLVKVTCEKGEERLVSILEAFDEMGLNVLQARVSCNHYFAMEAIVVEQDQALDVKDVTQALLKTLEKQGREGTQ